MENLRTIKIQLNIEQNTREILMNTMIQCQEVFNYFSKLGCSHKSTSYPTLHKYGYQEMKYCYPDLPTAYIQATAKQALSCLKAYNTQMKNKAKKSKKKKEEYRNNIWNYKGSKSSFSLQLNKLTLSRRGNLTTISSINRRIKILHDIPKWFTNKYQIQESNIQSGCLKYFPKSDEFVLYLTYRTNKSESQGTEIVGIDRGLYNLATLSDGTNISSKKCKTIKRKYQYLRNKLQQKGTKSAKRHLKKISGKEKRFMLDYNHQITKSLANRTNVSTYVLEDLKSIREQRKGKKLNSWLSNWSYFQFQFLLEYKCYSSGIKVEYVDPRYTSQKCNICGTIEKTNRQKSKYICSSCGYVEHADINAAKNIRDNYVRSLKSEQVVVNQPIVTKINL